MAIPYDIDIRFLAQELAIFLIRLSRTRDESGDARTKSILVMHLPPLTEVYKLDNVK